MWATICTNSLLISKMKLEGEKICHFVLIHGRIAKISWNVTVYSFISFSTNNLLTRAHRNLTKCANTSNLFTQSQREASVHNTVRPISVNNETRNRGLRVNPLNLSYPKNKETIFTTGARRNGADTHLYWSQARNDCEFYPYKEKFYRIKQWS